MRTVNGCYGQNTTLLRTANYKNICYALQQNTSWMTDTASPRHFRGTLRTAPPQSAQLLVLRLEHITTKQIEELHGSVPTARALLRLGATIFNVAKF